MVLVPVWEQRPDDPVVGILVDALLHMAAQLGPEGDVRSVSKAVQDALWERSGRSAAEAGQQVVSEDRSVAKDVF